MIPKLLLALCAVITLAGALVGRARAAPPQAPPPIAKPAAPVLALAAHPTEPRLAVASGGAINVWNGEGRLLVRYIGPKEAIRSVAFSPDGNSIVAGEAGRIWVWSMSSPAAPRFFPGPPERVTALAFSPDGAALAAGGGLATRSGAIWLLDPQTGKLRSKLEGHSDTVFALAYTRDGARLASASADRTVRIWKTPAGGGPVAGPPQTLSGHTHFVHGVAWSPDGVKVLSAGADGAVKAWDPSTGEQLQSIAAHPRQIWGLAGSPSGALIATAGQDRAARLYDAAGNAARVFEGLPAPATSTVFLAGGKQLAIGLWNGAVRLYNTDTGEQTAELAP